VKCAKKDIISSEIPTTTKRHVSPPAYIAFYYRPMIMINGNFHLRFSAGAILLALFLESFSSVEGFAVLPSNIVRLHYDLQQGIIVRSTDRSKTSTKLKGTEGSSLIPPCSGRNLIDPSVKGCPQGLTAPLAPDLTHVETSLLPSNPDQSDQAVYVFPLVIRPKVYTSNFCLRAFLSYNKEWVDEQILKYGAVLFRGFDITSAAEVEADIRSLEPNLNNEYRGTSPRITQPGSDFVFSAAEVVSSAYVIGST
jgi:hypothetical protein